VSAIQELEKWVDHTFPKAIEDAAKNGCVDGWFILSTGKIGSPQARVGFYFCKKEANAAPEDVLKVSKDNILLTMERLTENKTRPEEIEVFTSGVWGMIMLSAASCKCGRS
jgi:hypothetical protein